MKKNLFNFVAISLAAACAMICSCEEESFREVRNTNDNSGWTMSVNASKGSDVVTKALVADDETTPTKLSSTWSLSETVGVIGTTGAATYYGTIAPQAEGVSTNLSGELTTVPAENAELTLFFPGPADEFGFDSYRFRYTDQDGTLATVSSKYDYSMANVTVSEINEETKTITVDGNASFENQQAICAFKFTYNGAPLTVKSLSISAASGKLVRFMYFESNNVITSSYSNIIVTPATPTSDYIYVALRNESDAVDTYTFDIIDNDGRRWTGTAKAKLTAGKFSKATLKMDNDVFGLAVGNYLFTDGTYGSLHDNPGKTPAAVIFSTSVSEADAARGYIGYAVALKTALFWLWSNATGLVMPKSYEGESWDVVSANKDGLTETNYINVTKEDYPAFYYAKNMENSPEGTSGWYLPSVGQWYDILVNLGKMNPTITDTTPSDFRWSGVGTAETAASNMNFYLAPVEGLASIDKFRDIFAITSTEYNAENAFMVNSYDGYPYGDYIKFAPFEKTYAYGCVRPVVAFKSETAVNGTPKTATLQLAKGNIFKVKTSGILNDDQSNTWAATSNQGSYSSWNADYFGQQFGTKAEPWGGTFTADFSEKPVTSVAICANTSESAYLSVKVGSVSFKCSDAEEAWVEKKFEAMGNTYVLKMPMEYKGK